MKFGLIGKSLDHSWSQDYFERKFVKENITDCLYENLSLENIKDLREIILNDRSLYGLNVTTPYKIESLKYLDELDPVAEMIGAINCLKIIRNRNKLLINGYNTDMQAFSVTLKPLLNEFYRKALVLGTGGAARAVCYALKDMNIEYSTVSRKIKPGILSYSQITGHILSDHLLIINATPVGMFPNENQCPPLPYEALTRGHLLYDLIYNPGETLFLKKGAQAGAKIKSGLEMLELQAELSWKIWHEEL